MNPLCVPGAVLRLLSTSSRSIPRSINRIKQKKQVNSKTEQKYLKRELRKKEKKLAGESEVFDSLTFRRHRSSAQVILLDAKKAESILLYKDGDIVAINKPAGLAVHGGPHLSNDLSNHLHLWQYDGEIPNLAHRLDKDASGVLLLTRHTSAARRMARIFHDWLIKKTYWAIAVGVPNSLKGSVNIPLGMKNIATQQRHSMNRMVLRMDLAENSQDVSLPSGVHFACTKYKVLSVCSRRCCLMEVQPITGVKHQVRVHLADGLLCPILGDYKFGGRLFRSSQLLKKKVKSMDCVRGFMYLHAYCIEIPDYHAKGKPLVIKAPPPTHFVQSCKSMGLLLPKPYV